MNTNISFRPQIDPDLISFIAEGGTGRGKTGYLGNMINKINEKINESDTKQDNKTLVKPERNDKVKIIKGKFAVSKLTGVVIRTNTIKQTDYSLVKLDNDIYGNSLFISNENLEIVNKYIKRFKKIIDNEEVEVEIKGKEVRVILDDGTDSVFKNNNNTNDDILIAYYDAKMRQFDSKKRQLLMTNIIFKRTI